MANKSEITTKKKVITIIIIISEWLLDYIITRHIRIYISLRNVQSKRYTKNEKKWKKKDVYYFYKYKF